nr:MAG TPA: hypothetical protein [Caudoviricetes sp.]
MVGDILLAKKNLITAHTIAITKFFSLISRYFLLRLISRYFRWYS